jgi:hypothetical protein
VTIFLIHRTICQQCCTLRRSENGDAVNSYSGDIEVQSQWSKYLRILSGPSAKRTKDLLKLNRDQLRWVVGLLTGHCHLKGHLFKMGLTDDSTFERCLEEDESATHILCDCEAIAYLRFRHLGQFFMEPSDYYDASINRVLHFIRSTIDHWRWRCKAGFLAHPLYIHTYIFVCFSAYPLIADLAFIWSSVTPVLTAALLEDLIIYQNSTEKRNVILAAHSKSSSDHNTNLLPLPFRVVGGSL